MLNELAAQSVRPSASDMCHAERYRLEPRSDFLLLPFPLIFLCLGQGIAEVVVSCRPDSRRTEDMIDGQSIKVVNLNPN